MEEYKRFTERGVDSGFVSDLDCRIAYNKLSALEDKIENKTLVFKEEHKRYWAVIYHSTNFSMGFDWYLHNVVVDYRKDNGQVAVRIDGILFVTDENLLFENKEDAQEKLKELRGKNNE